MCMVISYNDREAINTIQNANAIIVSYSAIKPHANPSIAVGGIFVPLSNKEARDYFTSIAQVKVICNNNENSFYYLVKIKLPIEYGNSSIIVKVNKKTCSTMKAKTQL